jgi:hypothetical protein
MATPIGIPKPPPYFLARPNELESLVDSLLADDSTTVGVVGVQGMGGIGKTVLASVAAADPRVVAKYPDGVYWITLGQRPEMMVLQRHLALAAGFTMAESVFVDEAHGRMELQKQLKRKRVLLVLDDLWKLEHLAGFNVVASPGRLLVSISPRISRISITSSRN